MAAGMNAPITVMDTASEGGAWGMAILAAFMKEKETGETLSSYLNDKIFAGQTGTTLQPEPEDVKGFEAFPGRVQETASCGEGSRCRKIIFGRKIIPARHSFIKACRM